MQYPQKINLWSGIMINQIMDSYSIDDTLTDEFCWAFLELELISDKLFPDDNLNVFITSIWFLSECARQSSNDR